MTARIAVLVSGRGTNLAALIAAAAAPGYPGRVALAVSNKADAEGLARAAAAGVSAAIIPHTDYPDRDGFDAALDAAIRDRGCDLVVLAGFMRVLGDAFVRRWEGRLLNIHPSLLPAFPGLRTHEQALGAGVRISGCTAHFVAPALDAGPAIAQAAVPVLPQDDAATLGARVLRAEHVLYPHAVGLVASGAVRYAAGGVTVAGAPALSMFFPGS